MHRKAEKGNEFCGLMSESSMAQLCHQLGGAHLRLQVYSLFPGMDRGIATGTLCTLQVIVQNFKFHRDRDCHRDFQVTSVTVVPYTGTPWHSGWHSVTPLNSGLN